MAGSISSTGPDPCVVAHKRRGEGTHRWEVGWRLKGGATDGAFGKGRTKHEADVLASFANGAVAAYCARKDLPESQNAQMARVFQRPGEGRRRWEVGFPLKGRQTDRIFGQGMTKHEADACADRENVAIEKFVERQAVSAARSGLRKWISSVGAAVLNGKTREAEELNALRARAANYLRGAE
jgi:hypothetical protein